MPPSRNKIESALRAIIQKSVDDGEEDLLTVRYVRDRGVESLNLAEGFFLTDDWKDRSKAFIKRTAEELIDAKGQQPNASSEVASKSAKEEVAAVKQSPKRAAQANKPRPTKQQKKEAIASEEEELSEVEPSNLSEHDEGKTPSEFDDPDISDIPKLKKKNNSKPKAKVKAPNKRQPKSKRKAGFSEGEETSDSLGDVYDSHPTSMAPKKATKMAFPQRKSKEAVHDSELDPEHERSANKIRASNEKRQSKGIMGLSEKSSEEQKAAKEASGNSKRNSKNTLINSDQEFERGNLANMSKSPINTKFGATTKPEQSSAESPSREDCTSFRIAENEANGSASSDMSVVLDENPRPKKRESKSMSSKAFQIKTASSKEPRGELSPNDILIKTLQSQLVKCGVRKMWAFELKKYGGDESGKIRHLQGMLNDTGMRGRFSEQRARQIKELRELQADLEAVQEGEKHWGLDSGRRARGERKSLKDSSADEDEDGDGQDGEGKFRTSQSASAKPRRAAKAKEELAFLGDEDSDSN